MKGEGRARPFALEWANAGFLFGGLYCLSFLLLTGWIGIEGRGWRFKGWADAGPGKPGQARDSLTNAADCGATPSVGGAKIGSITPTAPHPELVVGVGGEGYRGL